MRKSTFVIALSTIAAAIWFSSQNHPRAAEPAQLAQGWEYKVWTGVTTAGLNEQGSKGWEVCGFAIDSREHEGGQGTAILKRPKAAK